MCLLAAATTGASFSSIRWRLRADAPTAMILPLPVPPNSREDALRFIDSRSYPGFFLDLQKPFVAHSKTRTGGGAAPQPLPILKVHRVGSFEASFVPSLDDFERLDPRFRLPRTVWDARYRWGFAVFKLQDLWQTITIEPMALSFPRRDRRAVLSRGARSRRHSDPTAHYDHNLFFQHPSEDAIACGGQSRAPRRQLDMAAREIASPLNARGVLDENLPVLIARFAGEFPNRDAQVAPEDPRSSCVARCPPTAPSRSSAASSRLASLVPPRDLAAAHAIVGVLPWTMQAPSYGEGFLHMPPELAKQDQSAGERSEVYGFGSLLFQLLSGEPPFGEYMEALIGHLTKPVRPLGSPLDGVIARAMHKDPAQRFPDLRALVEALAA